MGVEHPKFRAAAVQASSIFLDLEATIDKSIDLIREAASNGASLIAFPELFIPGYPWHVWLDSPAGAMRYTQQYFDNSFHYDSPEASRLAEAARANGIMVVMGLSERDSASLYIGQWLIGPDGETITRRRKLKPTHVERTVYGEGDGRDLAVFDTVLGRVGALCCWEHLQPLSKYAMYAQNEQVHVAAWPSFSVYGDAHQLSAEVNNAITRTYAVEGGCFVVAPTAVISRQMIDILCTDDTKKGLLREGGGMARIYSPDGKVISQEIDPTEEGIVYGEIDIGLISLAKMANDPAGHYARPDVTQLVLNRKAGHRLIIVDDASNSHGKTDIVGASIAEQLT